MRKSPWDLRFYQSKMYVVIMLCMTLCMTGCNVQEALGLTGDELFAQMESESYSKTRTLSLEELEDRAVAPDVSGNDAVEDTAESASYSISMGDSLLYGDACTYAEDKLSDSEKLWYRDMEQILGNMQESVKLSEAGLKAGLDESDVDRIFQCVLDDHPELFYVEGYSYTKYTRGDKTVAIEFTGTYNQDAETVYARKLEIEQVVEELISPARDLEDDYDKIKYVYETLIERTDYNLESEDNQNIYSVFVNKSSVCQGYAKAFQYLMYRLDVECALVQGKVLETGEGHAWNLVSSNGAYYYVDPTWGDISYHSTGQGDEQNDPGDVSADRADEKRLPGVSYDYLCITTEQLLRTHNLTEPEALPVCDSVADNYYVRENALFTKYNEEQMGALVDKRLAEGSSDIALRCSNEACYNEMREALIDRQEIFTYLAGSGIQSFVYSCNDSQLTLTFFMMTSQR